MDRSFFARRIKRRSRAEIGIGVGLFAVVFLSAEELELFNGVEFGVVESAKIFA